MTFQLGIKRKLSALHMGDILNIRIPFEENTRDYYNGYKPEEIRGKLFTDRFGNSSKKRMVIYIGRDGNEMLYLPITSKHTTDHDILHQYELKDTSMMPEGTVKRRSFVEVDSLRMIRISPQRELSYTGHIEKEDLENIVHRISNNTLQFDSKRDQRGYVPASMAETFENELTLRGYAVAYECKYYKTWQKGSTGQTIKHTKYGAVHYHYPMEKEDVRKYVSLREGSVILFPIEETNNSQKDMKSKEGGAPLQTGKQTAAFSDTVSSLSKYQRERTQYANTC